MNAQKLIEFLKHLIKYAKKKVILMLNILRAHHSDFSKEQLERRENKIETFYLPAYSPEMNPNKDLNFDLKAGVHSKLPASNKETAQRKGVIA